MSSGRELRPTCLPLSEDNCKWESTNQCTDGVSIWGGGCVCVCVCNTENRHQFLEIAESDLETTDNKYKSLLFKSIYLS